MLHLHAETELGAGICSRPSRCSKPCNTEDKTGLANTPPTKGSSISGWSLSKIHPFRKTISSEATSVNKWIRHCNTLKPTKPYKTTGANRWSMSISCRWAFQHVSARSFRTAAACAWKQIPLLRSGQVIVLHIFTVFSYIFSTSPLSTINFGVPPF